MIERKNIKKIIIYFLSIISFLIIWGITSHVINAPLILPTISQVFKEMVNLLTIDSFWLNFLYTIFRVFLTFIISLFFGIILGFLSGTYKSFKTFLELPLAFIRSTPVVAIILITLFWINSDFVPVFVGILMGLPIVVTSVTEGMVKNNENIMFMAKIYKFNFWQKIRYIKLNDLKPFIVNSALSVFGLSWKVVVAGEVLSLPKYGFGTLMQTAQIHLETATVIAITFILVLSSFILEKLFNLIVHLKTGGKNE